MTLGFRLPDVLNFPREELYLYIAFQKREAGIPVGNEREMEILRLKHLQSKIIKS